MMKERKPPKSTVVVGVLLLVAVLGILGIMGGAIMGRTKSDSLFRDVEEAVGPWTAVERFWDKHVLGYTDEEMDGIPQSPQVDDGDPFD